jgi:hypothetical protein
MAYLMLGCAGILWPEVLSDDHDDWRRINTYESPTDGGVAQRPALAEDDTEHRAVLRNVNEVAKPTTPSRVRMQIVSLMAPRCGMSAISACQTVSILES